ncbi:MAG: hypothetical protein QXI11_02015 [Thermoproteota archaeon]
MSEKKEVKVEEIELEIRRSEIPVFIEPGVYRTQLAITFWSREIPPQTVFIWKDEYTPEKERELIAEKLKEFLKGTTEKVKVRIERG